MNFKDDDASDTYKRKERQTQNYKKSNLLVFSFSEILI